MVWMGRHRGNLIQSTRKRRGCQYRGRQASAAQRRMALLTLDGEDVKILPNLVSVRFCGDDSGDAVDFCGTCMCSDMASELFTFIYVYMCDRVRPHADVPRPVEGIFAEHARADDSMRGESDDDGLGDAGGPSPGLIPSQGALLVCSQGGRGSGRMQRLCRMRRGSTRAAETVHNTPPPTRHRVL